MGVLTLAQITRLRDWRIEVLPLPDAAGRRSFLEGLGGADVIGFSTVCSTYPRVLSLARALRCTHPGAVVVLGGPQATSTARRTIEAVPEIDLVLRGEAESAWGALLDMIEAGGRDWSVLPGAVFRAGGTVHEIPMAPLEMDLDRLPEPDHSLDPGFCNGRRLAFEVGRGCPYACTFCSTNDFFRRRFRMKTPEHIVRQLHALRARFGTEHVDFIHDMFTVRRDTVEAICDAIEVLGMRWNCSARTDRLDAALLSRMVRAGCQGIYVGLETGSARLQRDVKKNLALDAAISTIRLCQALGLHVTASLIFGYPQERPEDLADTLRCYLELSLPHPSPMARGRITPQLHLFAPLPGTPILERAGGFAFDARLSTTVALEAGDGLTAEELAMVASDFPLFSAFYHATDNPVGRTRLLALDAVMAGLPRMPATLGHVAREAREAFVRHLVSAPCAAWDAALGAEAAQACLRDFAASRPFDAGLRQSLARDAAPPHHAIG